MTLEQARRFDGKHFDAMRGHNKRELAVAFLRYEALRKLNVLQFSELAERNRKGKAFDDLVDELVVKE